MTFICRFVIWTLALFLACSPANVSSQYVKKIENFIDPQVVLVEEWEGWGTSLAWWADMLGGMDESVVNAVMDAFFNPEKLNFNIVRYVIGGTVPGDSLHNPCLGEYRPGSASECFLDGPRPGHDYNWSRDPRQLKILKLAKEKGANIFEAFSNSPPQWMTVSGCSKGNYQRFPLHDNFDPINATIFADYVTDVMRHFETAEDIGIKFDYYAPFNEPFGLYGIGSWFGLNATQEGCNMNRETMVAVINAAYEKLNGFVKITAADETHINTAVGTAKYFESKGVSSKISKLNVHGYWDEINPFGHPLLDNRRDVLNIISHRGGQKLWMDEVGWPSTPLSNMTQALTVGKMIVKDLRHMMPSAWVQWQAMESTDQWGLIGVPYRFDATVEEIQYYSGYYGHLQFSKYIKKGSLIIYVSDPDAVAAYNPVEEVLTLVIVHNEDSTQPIERSFDLRRFLGQMTLASATRTSATEQNVDIASEVRVDRGYVHFTSSPETITTITIANTKLGDNAQLTNLIRHGDFEGDGDECLPCWNSTEEGDYVSLKDYSWRGNAHGYLPTNFRNESVLSQTFTLELEPGSGFQTRRLYLSLYASTVGGNTVVEALVNGNRMAETRLNPRVGYKVYGLSFSARVGDEVTIQIRTWDGSGPVLVDNVSLYSMSEVVPDSSGAPRHSSHIASLLIFLALVKWLI